MCSRAFSHSQKFQFRSYLSQTHVSVWMWGIPFLTVYKQYRHFAEERTELCDDLWSGMPLYNEFGEALKAMIQE
jgi:hypothetical protein